MWVTLKGAVYCAQLTTGPPAILAPFLVSELILFHGGSPSACLTWVLPASCFLVMWVPLFSDFSFLTGVVTPALGRPCVLFLLPILPYFPSTIITSRFSCRPRNGREGHSAGCGDSVGTCCGDSEG